MTSLQSSQNRGVFNYTGKVAVTNLTDVDVPVESLELLSLGEKFAIGFSKTETLPMFDVISDLEKVFSNVESQSTENTRNRCVNIITNHLRCMNAAPSRRVRQVQEVQRCYNNTRRFLNEHPDIIICKSDKGGNTVIMNRDDYNDKMIGMLSVGETYTRLARDPSSTYRLKVNRSVDDLLTLGCIDNRLASGLKSYNGVAPKIYGLPKLHKVGTPLRPIVSFINSPTYAMSKYIEGFLSRIVCDSNFNVKSSIEFKEALSHIVIDDNCVMVSLDVQSLFTNIPLDLAFKLIGEQWLKFGHVTGMSKQMFLSILELVCDARYFVFNSLVYRQCYGLPMGSPISPVLANIVMIHLLEVCSSQLVTSVKFLKLYVDDLFLVIKRGDEQIVLNCFNSFHPRIKFTIEIEQEGCLPYLDTKVVRGPNNSILTDWYSKPTSSGRILHFNSSHIMSQKLNCVKNLVKKVIDISSPCFRITNRERLRKFFENNGYPAQIVDRFWRRYLNQTDSEMVDVAEAPRLLFFRFPFVDGLSQRIQRLLRRDFPGVCLAFYNRRNVGTLFSRLKDRTPISLQSNVVYAIKCLDCDKIYYGETSRFIKERTYQHDYSIRTKKVNSTALAGHAVSLNHNFDFPGIKVCAHELDDQKRKCLEMLFIKKDSSAINYRSDIDHLNIIYSDILV